MTLGKARNTIKMREAFPFLSFFFFWSVVIGCSKSHTGILVRASQGFEQSVDRAPLGAGIEGKKACPKLSPHFLSSHTLSGSGISSPEAAIPQN